MTTTTYRVLFVLETIAVLSFPTRADEAPPALAPPRTGQATTEQSMTEKSMTEKSMTEKSVDEAHPTPSSPHSNIPLPAPLFRIQPSRARWTSTASGGGNFAFLAIGTAAPLLAQNETGKQRTFRTMDAVVTSMLLCEGLKILSHEKRPDGADARSFPSGHATAAFALAAMQAHYHPGQSLLWYSGAALIGASRVKLKRHYWHDVLAGAALGYATARVELHQDRGLLFRPFIQSKGSRQSGTGLSMSSSF